jgi:hypothetical protein
MGLPTEEAAGPPKGATLAPKIPDALMLTLISAELWCALLWALTGAVVASAVALLLGCGVVLASYLSGP